MIRKSNVLSLAPMAVVGVALIASSVALFAPPKVVALTQADRQLIRGGDCFVENPNAQACPQPQNNVTCTQAEVVSEVQNGIVVRMCNPTIGAGASTPGKKYNNPPMQPANVGDTGKTQLSSQQNAYCEYQFNCEPKMDPVTNEWFCTTTAGGAIGLGNAVTFYTYAGINCTILPADGGPTHDPIAVPPPPMP